LEAEMARVLWTLYAVTWVVIFFVLVHYFGTEAWPTILAGIYVAASASVFAALDIMGKLPPVKNDDNVDVSGTDAPMIWE
jgi:hypothetical protein